MQDGYELKRRRAIEDAEEDSRRFFSAFRRLHWSQAPALFGGPHNDTKQPGDRYSKDVEKGEAKTSGARCKNGTKAA